MGVTDSFMAIKPESVEQLVESLEALNDATDSGLTSVSADKNWGRWVELISIYAPDRHREIFGQEYHPWQTIPENDSFHVISPAQVKLLSEALSEIPKLEYQQENPDPDFVSFMQLVKQVAARGGAMLAMQF